MKLFSMVSSVLGLWLSLSSVPALASAEFLAYCQSDLPEAEQDTLTRFFKRVNLPQEKTAENCEALEKKFLATTNVGLSAGDGIGPATPMGVTDITILKFFPHITMLALRNNPVNDLSPLKALTQLELLDVRKTDVEDLAPLKTLTTLRRLGLAESKVAKIGRLGSEVLKNLTQLHVHKLNLVDWDEIKAATNLKEFSADGSNIESLEPIAGATGLTKLSLLDTKNLKSLDGIAGLTALETLDVKGAPLTRLELGTLTKLTRLLAEDLKLTETPNLSALKSLDKVSLDNSQLTTMPELAPSVTLVSVFDNAIVDIGPLKNLPNLVTARLKNTKVVDLTPLAGLKKLDEVDIRKTPVTDVSPLKDLIDLTWLYVGGSSITVEKAEAQLPELVKTHKDSKGEDQTLYVDEGPSSGGFGIGLGL